MIYFAYRVIKLTKCQNYRLVLFFAGMNLTILASIIKLSVLIYNTSIELDKDWDGEPVNYDYEYVTRHLKDFLMQETIVVNLNIWVYYWI